MRLIVRCFAVIGFLATLLCVLGFIGNYYQQKQAVKEPEALVLALDLDQTISEDGAGASPLNFAMPSSSVTLMDIIRAIDHAGKDPHVKGIVARFGSSEPSFAQTQEITAALQKFRATGKLTYAFGTNYGEFGFGNRTYYLASAFENIWLQPVGTVSLTGLATFSPFGKIALDKIGLKADFMQREEYKSFMDMATRDDYAPPVRQNMQSIIDDLSDQEATTIAENRKWDVAHVQELMAKGPYTDEEALKLGLITRIGYSDELDKELEDKAGKDAKDVDVGTYLSYRRTDKESKPKAKIAYILGSGMIMDHDVEGVDGLTGEKVMGADTVAEAFDSAADDKDVKAILFRVDSPGGSPSASETIRRAMIHAQAQGKPVFVSMGDMAASGGYWISMNADEIIAEPGTLTGSIGVIGGKFADNGLMQKLGVNVGVVRTAENAGMWMPIAPFTAEQRERVNAMLDNSYRAFTQNVATARKIPLEKMPDIAKGRVWTGAQAQKLGLVDEIGGYTTTLAAIRKKLGLAPNDPVILQPYPPPETPIEKIEKLLKSFGVELSMVGSVVTKWQAAFATLAPFLRDMGIGESPIAARALEPFIH